MRRHCQNLRRQSLSKCIKVCIQWNDYSVKNLVQPQNEGNFLKASPVFYVSQILLTQSRLSLLHSLALGQPSSLGQISLLTSLIHRHKLNMVSAVSTPSTCNMDCKAIIQYKFMQGAKDYQSSKLSCLLNKTELLQQIHYQKLFRRQS